MKINIWLDVRCPFCYIEKRQFEMALNQFQQKDKVEIIWHSFELDTEIKTNTTVDALDYFSGLKKKTV